MNKKNKEIIFSNLEKIKKVSYRLMILCAPLLIIGVLLNCFGENASSNSSFEEKKETLSFFQESNNLPLIEVQLEHLLNSTSLSQNQKEDIDKLYFLLLEEKEMLRQLIIKWKLEIEAYNSGNKLEEVFIKMKNFTRLYELGSQYQIQGPKKEIDKLRIALLKKQIEVFPKIRIAYKEQLYQKLRTQGISIIIEGKKLENLVILDGRKHEITNEIRQELKKYRFKKIQFKSSIGSVIVDTPIILKSFEDDIIDFERIFT